MMKYEKIFKLEYIQNSYNQLIYIKTKVYMSISYYYESYKSRKDIIDII